MRFEKPPAQYRSYSSRSNRSSPSFILPRVHGGGGKDAGSSDGLNRLNGWNGLNSGSFVATNQHARASIRQILHCISIAALLFLAVGCDPILNIGGTFFP